MTCRAGLVFHITPFLMSIVYTVPPLVIVGMAVAMSGSGVIESWKFELVG